MELAVAIATVIVDLQVDFFVSHPRLIRSRPSLASHVNALVAEARQSRSPIFWIKQVFAPDLQDAPIDVRQGGHRITVEGTAGVELLPELVVAPSDFVMHINETTKSSLLAIVSTPMTSSTMPFPCDISMER
jgi:nicotinamidase-related amidase